MMTFGFTLAACLIGSRIPDWIDSGDRPGHRGFGHSLLSLFIFAFIALIVSGYFVDKDLAVLHAVALAAGYLSQLVLDFVTYKGVPWFWPLDEKYFLDLDSAGGLLVGSLGFLAFVLSIYLLADRFLVAIVLLLRAGYPGYSFFFESVHRPRTGTVKLVLPPLLLPYDVMHILEL
jgi:membrane-bound metal-dependent hydrolase YbcI (DUF457 family)